MASEAAKITLFACSECYVYQIPPASTASGHRANDWNVDKWLKDVSLKVVSAGDDASVSLYDRETKELFAECPLPDNPANFSSSVEAVLDSSRYFVLKIVDTSSGSKRHAFIGLGFRERGQASDFNEAIDEHRQYLRRKREADLSKAEFAASEEAKKDYSLQPGEKIVIKLSNNKSPSSQTSRKLSSQKSPGLGILPPPPSFTAGKEPPVTSTTPNAEAWVADFDSEEAKGVDNKVVQVTGNALKDGEGFEDDQWGEFQ